MMMIAMKLTDNEWRAKCEELAEQELRRKKRREDLEEEASEWSERKKELQARIDSLTERIEKLALEVSTRETMRDAQTELPLQPAESTDESPSANDPTDLPAGQEPTDLVTPESLASEGSEPPSEEPQAELEPGAEG